jgi:hypothetical protein
MGTNVNAVHRQPWNKGKIVGQKAPFKLKDIWALRVRLQMESRVRELALFNLGIDSKLRGCGPNPVLRGPGPVDKVMAGQTRSLKSACRHRCVLTLSAMSCPSRPAGLERGKFCSSDP